MIVSFDVESPFGDDVFGVDLPVRVVGEVGPDGERLIIIQGGFVCLDDLGEVVNPSIGESIVS